jgi:thiol oxidase
MKVSVALLCVTLFAVVLPFGSGRPQKDSSEEPTIGLIQLDDANFLGTLAELNYDRVLLEFYSHWCPACKRFQPDYKKLATHIHELTEKEDAAWEGNVSGSRPLRLAVARLDCPENTRLCDDFEITRYPTMLLDSPVHFSSKTLGEKVEVNPKSRSFNSVLEELEKLLGRSFKSAVLPEGGVSSSESVGEAGNDDITSEKKKVKINSESKLGVREPVREVEADILGATIESFEYLKSQALLKGLKARSALIGWMQLLEKSHFIEECRLGAKAAINSLENAWPESANEIQNLDSFRSLQICGNKQHGEWSNCKGSNPESRGYTCGLWMLFHSLSVRMPESSSVPTEAGQQWLDALRGYIQYFFQCKECADHFLEMINSQESKLVKSKNDGILWLWRTHNKVNKRLAEEQDDAGAGDPLFPHAQWPSKDLCPKCHGKDSWNEEEIIKFLMQHYHGASIQDMKSTSVQNAATRPVKPGSSWTTAYAIVGVVAATVYASLRGNYQYSLRKGPQSTKPSRAFK